MSATICKGGIWDSPVVFVRVHICILFLYFVGNNDLNIISLDNYSVYFFISEY